MELKRLIQASGNEGSFGNIMQCNDGPPEPASITHEFKRTGVLKVNFN